MMNCILSNCVQNYKIVKNNLLGADSPATNVSMRGNINSSNKTKKQTIHYLPSILLVDTKGIT